MKFTTGIDSKGKIVDEGIFNEGLKYFAGKRVVLRCDEEKQKRTLDQNDALWRWNDILGNHLGYTSRDMHYAMLGEIFGWREIKIHETIIALPRKTSSELNTKEFSDYVTNYFNKAQELFNYELPPFGWGN